MAPPADSADASVVDATETQARRERADAQRNRTRILEAARDVFANQGISCQIDEIARRAGVGTGTIYRNFPTKQALLEAILVDGVHQKTAEARALTSATNPTAAFFDFLSQMITGFCAHRALSETMATAGIDVKAAKASASQEMWEAVEHLLRRAQAAGGVKEDVGISELMALVAGTCQAAAQHDANVEWLNGFVRDGLRPSR